MAKISAHGSIVGTVDYTTQSKRYMSDGVILRNDGFGWKLHGKVQAGVTPREAYANSKARLDAQLIEKPAAARYRELLHAACGLSKRWKLHKAIIMMPDDPDGVWSEACDGYGDNVHLDVDDVAELCRAYQATLRQHVAA
jgi:hypothetical protein